MGHPRYGSVVSAVVDMLEVSSWLEVVWNVECESEVMGFRRVRVRMRVRFLMAEGRKFLKEKRRT